MPNRFRSHLRHDVVAHPAQRIALGALALAVFAALLFSASGAAAPGGDSAATITGSFADSCRDFSAHSSKDISHVEIHYADGRDAKDESTTTPDFTLDGGAGNEIDFAIVKSGTTSERFDCTTTNSPPVAILEVKTPESCSTYDDGAVACDGRDARATWMHSFVPTVGYGIVWFGGCGWPDDQSCVDHVMPCEQEDFFSLCQVTYTYRGTSSSDPDDDIVSWSIDFGDGSSVSGDWTTNPPSEVSHEYLIHRCPTCSRAPATLTVTDSAGQSDSDAQFVDHQFPD